MSCTGAGTCTPKPTVTTTYDPVCGCDNVTYYNATIAATSFGANIKSATGECAFATAAKCSANGKCDGSRVCSYAVASAGACNVIGGADPGVCWGMPKSCPVVTGKLSTCNGGGQSCMSRCAAIQQGHFYFPDAACP